MSAMSTVYILQQVWHVLSTLKRTITKSTLNTIEGTTYLCALCQHIAPGACATSTIPALVKPYMQYLEASQSLCVTVDPKVFSPGQCPTCPLQWLTVCCLFFDCVWPSHCATTMLTQTRFRGSWDMLLHVHSGPHMPDGTWSICMLTCCPHSRNWSPCAGVCEDTLCAVDP